MTQTRSFLQDFDQPYRYTDDTVVAALNSAMFELSRIRPDIFLTNKYKIPLACCGPLMDMIPQLFNATRPNITVPIPSSLFMAVNWYMAGLIQFYDVDDTQDVRAQSFSQKFQGAVMGLTV